MENRSDIKETIILKENTKEIGNIKKQSSTTYLKCLISMNLYKNQNPEKRFGKGYRSWK